MKKYIIIFSVLYAAVVNAQNTPPSPPCANPEIDFHAIVLEINKENIHTCSEQENDIEEVNVPSGAVRNFNDKIDGAFFHTSLDISSLTPLDNQQGAFVNMMEISKEYTAPELPNNKSSILTTSIYYDPIADNNSHYSLVLNYNTANSPDSITIPLVDKNFDLQVFWVNSTCLYSQTVCKHELGQIEVRITSQNSNIVKTIDNLHFEDSVIKMFMQQMSGQGQLWQAQAVYWGELDTVNMVSKKLVFSRPN